MNLTENIDNCAMLVKYVYGREHGNKKKDYQKKEDI